MKVSYIQGVVVGFFAGYILGFGSGNLFSSGSRSISSTIADDLNCFEQPLLRNRVDIIKQQQLLLQQKIQQKQQEEEQPAPCSSKYVLLTSQRSGSTWVCDLLNRHPSIACGGPFAKNPHEERVSELLIAYSYKHQREGGLWNVTWPQYKESLDKAYDSVCTENPNPSIGFKLMYNQIPNQFVEDGRLARYFREHNVHLVHLVREAKILKMASTYSSVAERVDFGSMHASNQSMVEKFRESPKMPWHDELIDKMLEIEQRAIDWQRTIHFMPHVADSYLSYEKMLIPDERRRIFLQLTNELVPGYYSQHPQKEVDTSTTNLMQLHEPTCEDRINRYLDFTKHEKVQNSRTLAACNMLQTYFGMVPHNILEQDELDAIVGNAEFKISSNNNLVQIYKENPHFPGRPTDAVNVILKDDLWVPEIYLPNYKVEEGRRFVLVCQPSFSGQVTVFVRNHKDSSIKDNDEEYYRSFTLSISNTTSETNDNYDASYYNNPMEPHQNLTLVMTDGLWLDADRPYYDMPWLLLPKRIQDLATQEFQHTMNTWDNYIQPYEGYIARWIHLNVTQQDALLEFGCTLPIWRKQFCRVGGYDKVKAWMEKKNAEQALLLLRQNNTNATLCQTEESSLSETKKDDHPKFVWPPEEYKPKENSEPEKQGEEEENNEAEEQH